jgi:hypothetical protein
MLLFPLLSVHDCIVDVNANKPARTKTGVKIFFFIESG